MSTDLLPVPHASNSKSAVNLLVSAECFVLCPLLICITTACSVAPKTPETVTLPQSTYTFDYTVANGGAINLIRAFSGDDKTYLQFRSTPPTQLALVARSENGGSTPLAHNVMGNYAVLNGVHPDIEVAGTTLPITIRKRGSATRSVALPIVATPSPVRAAPPAVTCPAPAPTNAAAAEPATPRAQPAAHFVRFARNTARLGPQGRRDVQALAQLAGSGVVIEIRTRAAFPSRRASVKLAERRAQAIRAALVALGVSPAIRTSVEHAEHALRAEVRLVNDAGDTSNTSNNTDRSLHGLVGMTI